MKRTRAPIKLQANLMERLQTLQTITSRLSWISGLGSQYDGDRNLYQALGYPDGEITFREYWKHYKRQDIAAAIINRPVNVTWRGHIQVLESDDHKLTQFEKGFKDIFTQFGLKNKFVRIDKLTGLGKYGVLLLGFSDVNNSLGLSKPVQKGKNLKLTYVKPISQENATVQSYETAPDNPRFGYPKMYQIKVTLPEGNTTQEIQVHYTRVIHIVDGELESDIEGTPRLEVVYNRLMDLEKLIGGSAEMFWRGARPGYQNIVDKDYTFGTEQLAALQSQIDEYEHKLRRILNIEGGKLESLATQISDPKNHVDIQFQMISSVTEIPKRMLTGSERGELASTQDQDEYRSYVKARREEYAEVKIIRPFIDRLVEFGVISEPTDDYSIEWEDLFAPSDKEKAEVAKTSAEALKAWAGEPMLSGEVPLDAFLSVFFNLSDDQIELIKSYRDAQMLEEINNRPLETVPGQGQDINPQNQ